MIMKHQTHHQLVCGRLADDCCKSLLGYVQHWRQQEAAKLLNAAIAEAFAEDEDLTDGEKALVEAIRSKFAVKAATDIEADKRAHELAHALAQDISNRSGARELFGFVEDVANGKASALGEEGKARARQLYDLFHPVGRAETTITNPPKEAPPAA